jgi:tetratricopeptide (TPR) repeat protein
MPALIEADVSRLTRTCSQPDLWLLDRPAIIRACEPVGSLGPMNTMTETIKKPRRAMLEEFLSAHPKDPFARYGLAVECAGQGDATGAIENFDKLLADNPNYVAGYLQYGQFLARLSRTADARRTLTNGIEVARRTGDQHAGSEMETALAQLPA